MASDDPLDQAKKATEVVAEIIRAAGDSPDVRAAGGELGKTALTITRCINNALLPLAAVNFAFDKARTYFSERFADDLSARVSDIPLASVREPKASIAGPALQGLAFSHDELDLKEMYLRLLATAMDHRQGNTAHPSFVEIIKQLSGDEAAILNQILKLKNSLALIEVRLHKPAPSGFSILHKHIIDSRESSGEPTEDAALPAYIENWARLGLFDIRYDIWLNDAASYAWVESRPEVMRARRTWPALPDEPEGKEHLVKIQRGVLVQTEFGRQFARAVGHP